MAVARRPRSLIQLSRTTANFAIRNMQGRWEIKQVELTMGALAIAPEQSKLMLANAHLKTCAAIP
jgi:hypothetical protein